MRNILKKLTLVKYINRLYTGNTVTQNMNLGQFLRIFIILLKSQPIWSGLFFYVKVRKEESSNLQTLATN